MPHDQSSESAMVSTPSRFDELHIDVNASLCHRSAA
jgi:hypothetical protein